MGIFFLQHIIHFFQIGFLIGLFSPVATPTSSPLLSHKAELPVDHELNWPSCEWLLCAGHPDESSGSSTFLSKDSHLCCICSSVIHPLWGPYLPYFDLVTNMGFQLPNYCRRMSRLKRQMTDQTGRSWKGSLERREYKLLVKWSFVSNEGSQNSPYLLLKLYHASEKSHDERKKMWKVIFLYLGAFKYNSMFFIRLADT